MAQCHIARRPEDKCRRAMIVRFWIQTVSLLTLAVLGFVAPPDSRAGEPLSAPTADATGGRPASIDYNADPADLLSTYNLFKDPRKQIPNEGVIPYDLNTPHFADYATLHRFIWMPKGSSCQYGPHGEFEFPTGATIILTVGYARDLRDPKSAEHVLETRLWIRKPEGWIGAQYVWNNETTEAKRSLAGERIDVAWIHSDGKDRHHTFRVPNRNQCLQCHEIDERLIPLGPVHAQYLNKSFPYSHGQENQLEYWSKIGYLSGLPSDENERPRVAVWNDPSTGNLNARARAYLDMNCSSCHRKGGIAITSGLDLSLDQDEPVRFGIFKAPVAAGRGAGIGRFVIEPGHPERSIMIVRMESTDPGVRMPVVGRGLMHAEGVELIREWISQMDYPQMTANQEKIDDRASAGLRAFQNMTDRANVDSATKEK
jgi:uncharacterized repeat protein (TIGR03806 family)